MRILFVALSTAAVAGCSSVTPDPGWVLRPARVTDSGEFADLVPEFSGVDAAAAADRIRPGDRILYGVELRHGDERRRWLVYIEVEDPEFDPCKWRDGKRHYMLRLVVRVCDKAGEELGRDLVVVSRDYVAFGLVEACRGRGGAAFNPASPIPIPADVAGNLALRNMLRVIRESDVLADVLWTVLDGPSLYSVILRRRVEVFVETNFTLARTVDAVAVGDREVAAWEFPAEVRVNGTPALRSKVVVTAPDSPLSIGAGILAIDAFRPSDPSARVLIRLLAARRADDRVDCLR